MEFKIWKASIENMGSIKADISVTNIFGNNNAVFCQRHKCNSRRMYPQIHGISLPRWRGAIKVSWTVSRGNEGPRTEECLSMNCPSSPTSFFLFFFLIRLIYLSCQKKTCTKLLTITIYIQTKIVIKIKLILPSRKVRSGIEKRERSKNCLDARLDIVFSTLEREKKRESIRMRNPRGIEDPRGRNEEGGRDMESDGDVC